MEEEEALIPQQPGAGRGTAGESQSQAQRHRDRPILSRWFWVLWLAPSQWEPVGLKPYLPLPPPPGEAGADAVMGRGCRRQGAACRYNHF